jgi:hypothetical protein
MAIPVTQVISHWSHFFQNFSFSANEFYSQLEQVLKTHAMPNTAMGRTNLKEGGIFSSAREYFRIKHGELVFDVCAAPFGSDFFISWWLYESEGGMKQFLKFTKMGEFLAERASKRTFYQIDEEEMFRSCVHDCILETVQKVTEGKGLRALTEQDRAYKAGGM